MQVTWETVKKKKFIRSTWWRLYTLERVIWYEVNQSTVFTCSKKLCQSLGNKRKEGKMSRVICHAE